MKGDSDRGKSSLTPYPTRLTPVLGFTFIELIFITVVLALLVVGALPRFQQGWSRLQTEAVTFELAQTLRTARTLAITQGQSVKWIWDAEARSVRLEGPQDDGSPKEVASPSIPERFARARTIPDRVVLEVSRDGTQVHSVSFFPDGTSQPTTLLVGGDSRPRYQIGVDETTGQVAIQTASLPAR